MTFASSINFEEKEKGRRKTFLQIDNETLDINSPSIIQG
jgi:hypothetical protein